MKFKGVLFAFALCGLMVIGLLSPLTGNASADWNVTGTTLTGGPTIGSTVYHSENTIFSYTLSVSSLTGKSSVTIYEAYIQFDWETSGTECLGGDRVIVVPGTMTFQRSILIPDTVIDGEHTVKISLLGIATGDWWNTWGVWNMDFTVGTRQPLQLIISGNPSGGATPLAVLFTPTVTGGTPPYSYAWTFGDGLTSTQTTPTHSYTSSGSFTTTLLVTDNLGRTAQATFSISTYAPLTITPSADYTLGDRPMTVHFQCTATGGSPVYSYSWNFGDGDSSTEASPTHIYHEVGVFSVNLVVTDSESRQQTYHTTITVNEPQAQVNQNNFWEDETTLLIIAGIIAVIAIVVIAAVVMKRKKKPES